MFRINIDAEMISTVIPMYACSSISALKRAIIRLVKNMYRAKEIEFTIPNVRNMIIMILILFFNFIANAFYAVIKNGGEGSFISFSVGV